MGDTSVIARRLSGKYVQYGWGGNGGVFRSIGIRLLVWYDDPDMVEYLFSLGQVSHLWEPHSEESSRIFRTHPTNQPHWVGTSERQIFREIAFVDEGYFYDSDQTWYYIVPGPFRIKIPLEMVSNNLDEDEYEFRFLRQVEHRIVEKITGELYETDKAFRNYMEDRGYDSEEVQKLAERLAGAEDPILKLYEDDRVVFDYFDDWVVIRPAEDEESVGSILLRPREAKHTETILWEDGIKKEGA